VRIEWRGPQLELLAKPTRRSAAGVLALRPRQLAAEVQQACARAALSSQAYARSHFVPQADGLGLELMELCLPQVSAGRSPATWWRPIR
jgi:two-component system sensor histidine kinase DctS